VEPIGIWKKGLFSPAQKTELSSLLKTRTERLSDDWHKVRQIAYKYAVKNGIIKYSILKGSAGHYLLQKRSHNHRHEPPTADLPVYEHKRHCPVDLSDVILAKQEDTNRTHRFSTYLY